MNTSVILNLKNNSYTEKELVQTAAKIWNDDIRGEEIETIEVYIRPADRRCYCFVNGEPFNFGI